MTSGDGPGHPAAGRSSTAGDRRPRPVRIIEFVPNGPWFVPPPSGLATYPLHGWQTQGLRRGNVLELPG